MRRQSLLPLAALCASAAVAHAQVPPPERQIAVAVSAAPADMQAGATVMGYRNYHRLVTLRSGNNDMVCLGDDPSIASFHVACYHHDLEPFMAMGRELEAAGKTRQQIDSLRLAAVQSGAIKMPDGPRALYNLYASADSIDSATGLAHHPFGLQVVYIPYATEATTGIPTKPGGGLPWIMYAGKPWAHIMIVNADE